MSRNSNEPGAPSPSGAATASTERALSQFRGFLRSRALRVTDVREAIVRAALAR